MLSRAGFSVDVITSASLMRSCKFVRHCDLVPLRHSLIPTITQSLKTPYDWILITEDGTLGEILRSDLSTEEKRRLLPVTSEENFDHLYSKIGLSKAFFTHGVNTPPSFAAHDKTEALSRANQLGYPILIKRDASGGGDWVFACNSPSDFDTLHPRLFAKPVLVQKKISGIELDLSALYLEGDLVHFSYAKTEKSLKKFGPSILRTYYSLNGADEAIFHELRQIGKALGAHGFANIGCIQSNAGRFYFEADMRPNVWVEVTKHLGEDPAIRIQNWFSRRETLNPPTPSAHPASMLIPYFLRLRWFELLTNRYNVWKFIPGDDRKLIARLLAQTIVANIAKGMLSKKYLRKIRDWLAARQ